MYNKAHQFQGQKLEGQGYTMRINVETKACHNYLPNWKAYELQTWYTDEAR